MWSDSAGWLAVADHSPLLRDARRRNVSRGWRGALFVLHRAVCNWQILGVQIGLGLFYLGIE